MCVCESERERERRREEERASEKRMTQDVKRTSMRAKVLTRVKMWRAYKRARMFAFPSIYVNWCKNGLNKWEMVVGVDFAL